MNAPSLKIAESTRFWEHTNRGNRAPPVKTRAASWIDLMCRVGGRWLTRHVQFEPALGIGDLVVVGEQGQGVWEIVNVRHGVARVVARSTHLGCGRMRSIPLVQLSRYDHDRVESYDA